MHILESQAKSDNRRKLQTMKTEQKPKKVQSAVTAVFLAVTILIAIALAGVRILGYTPYAILSSSMSPKYEAGDLVYVRGAEKEEIGEGDVITFIAGEDLTVVTHRVERIDEEGNFVTKGDANDSEDANHVIYENVIGKVSFSLPKLGYISVYLKSPGGKYVGAAIMLILLIMILWPDGKTKKG